MIFNNFRSLLLTNDRSGNLSQKQKSGRRSRPGFTLDPFRAVRRARLTSISKGLKHSGQSSVDPPTIIGNIKLIFAGFDDPELVLFFVNAFIT